MKLCKVTGDTVVVPVMPELRWDEMPDPLSVVNIQKRYVHLKPREIDGHVVFVAYDRDTDTLFIRDAV